VPAMQGLTFWIGHRRALYNGYLLTEGALVAEACNLIYANLGDCETLLCEQLYRTLVDGWTLGQGCRADLVVRADSREAAGDGIVASIIEVKRGSSSPSVINEDLKRLAATKDINPHVRAFLILVSESRRPKRFVDKRGKGIRGEIQFGDNNFYCQVRRACKAALSFERKDSAHYACIVEVFKR